MLKESGGLQNAARGNACRQDQKNSASEESPQANAKFETRRTA